MRLSVGEIIDGKYQIQRLLGEGGTGAVYEGLHLLIHRRIAIKVLHSSAKVRDPGLIERFEREAQAAGRIGNDHILEILDVGSLRNGERYLVMEFLDGETLASRLEREGQLSPEALKPILEQTLTGLGAAHKAGIIHRDLKPDNIFILREKAGVSDFVKLIDFGISKFNSLTETMSMTSTGALLGTPYFMSPEQARGAESVTPLSDIYSIGVIAYQAITGCMPHDGPTVNELMISIVVEEPTPIEVVAPNADRNFTAIVKKAMAKDPQQRYQSTGEFLAAVTKYHAYAQTMDLGTPQYVEGGNVPRERPRRSDGRPQQSRRARADGRSEGDRNAKNSARATATVELEEDFAVVVPLSPGVPRWMLASAALAFALGLTFLLWPNAAPHSVEAKKSGAGFDAPVTAPPSSPQVLAAAPSAPAATPPLSPAGNPALAVAPVLPAAPALPAAPRPAVPTAPATKPSSTSNHSVQSGASTVKPLAPASVGSLPAEETTPAPPAPTSAKPDPSRTDFGY